MATLFPYLRPQRSRFRSSPAINSTFGPPTHIKIDVEGYEAAVVRGAKRTLARLAPLLFLELHNEMIHSEGSDPSHVLDDLEEMRYEMFSIDGVKIDRSATLQSRLPAIHGSFRDLAKN
jgi:hypothetical protein